MKLRTRDIAVLEIMMEMMDLLRLKDSGSCNIHMHSISGDMEREEF